MREARLVIGRREAAAVSFVTAALCTACSAERTREETSGAVATTAVIAAAPVGAAGLLNRIRARDPRADAERSFAVSGAVFLVYSSSIDARPATLEAHGIVMPAGSVEARRGTDIVEDVPVRELQKLVAPDPAHDPGPVYTSDTYFEFYRARRDYVGAFNERVFELATEPPTRSTRAPSRSADASSR